MAGGDGSNNSSLVWLTTSTLILSHTKKIASKHIDNNSKFEMELKKKNCSIVNDWLDCTAL